MKLSPVSGIAGSIRAECMTKADLTAAEKHGKRLDTTSIARAITIDPPVTTTGLELRKLYRQHVKNAFVPKCKTMAKHIIVQFPKGLVDGENAEFMLQHARQAVESIFGHQSIFADRVDRDERGRHIVDIFVAPKYNKTTKHTEQLAVTVTRHEEALAAKYGRTNSTYGRGQAMQDAIFAYFRDVMQLPGVQRGNPKTNPGADWKHAEQLREDELDEKKEQLEAQLKQASEKAAEAERLLKQAAADGVAAQEMREKAKTAEKQTERDRLLAKQLREEAETMKREAEESVRNAEQERQRSDREVQDKKTALERQEAELAKLVAAAAEKASKAQADAETARRNLISSRAALAEAVAERAATKADRDRIGQEQSLHQKQLALVARAVDDGNGLDLKLADDTVTINRLKMTEEEKVTHSSKWPAYIIAMARTIAIALQKLRDMAASLALREQAAAKQDAGLLQREAELKRDQAAWAAARAEHEKNVSELDRRAAHLAEAEKAAAKNAAEAQQKLKVADFEALVTKSMRENQNNWITVMRELEKLPEDVFVAPSGHISVSQGAEQGLPPGVVAYLANEPPEWATALVEQRHDLATAQREAAEKSKAADKAAEDLKAMIEQAGPLLTPAKEQAAKEAQQVLMQSGYPGQDFGI